MCRTWFNSLRRRRWRLLLLLVLLCIVRLPMLLPRGLLVPLLPWWLLLPASCLQDLHKTLQKFLLRTCA